MSDLANALTMLLSTLRSPGSDFQAAHERRARVHQTLPDASPEEIAAATDRIAASLRKGEFAPGPGGMAAITGGALVECGAPSHALGEAILGRLPRLLADTERFQAACHAKLPPLSEGEGASGGHAHDHSHDHGGDCSHDATMPMGGRDVPIPVVEKVAQGDFPGAMAFEALESWCLPAIACLTRDPALRSVARANQELCAQARATLGSDGFLTLALEVLDDEPFLVLHPSTGQGYRLKISGVADNFQLHLLLAGALVPADDAAWGLPGERPAEEALAIALGQGQQAGPSVTALWNLYTWRAISPEGRLRDEVPQEHRVRNEGRPVDIEPYLAAGEDPLRVIILGPTADPRGWRATRIFGGLTPCVDVEVLTADEVKVWLGRLAQG
jgi:hypothetical protein